MAGRGDGTMRRLGEGAKRRNGDGLRAADTPLHATAKTCTAGRNRSLYLDGRSEGLPTMLFRP
jgi:hypothetical protein